MPRPVLDVAVLGRVEVRRDGSPVAVPGGLSAELLVRLALEAGRPVGTERLLAELWPAGAGRNTLQAKVSQLRRALGPEVLAGGAAGYALAVDPARVDALRALRLADECAALLAAGDAAPAAERARTGLDLFAPEILPAAGDADWVVPHRARLGEARLRLTEDGLAARARLGSAGELVGELEALVAEHPLRERLWALLVTALYRAGRQSDALAAHRRITRLLADELGIDPGPELKEIGARVLAQDPALTAPPGSVPPGPPDTGAAGRRDPGAAGSAGPVPDPAPAGSGAARPPGPRPGNLPALTAPLVGRAEELAGLNDRLAEHRLVTLVGPAGVGKTRLATEAARHDPAPDGAWLVSLEGARTAADVPLALTEAVPGVEGVEDLRGTRALLVLDNCEHLVEAAAELVGRIAATAPEVRVLATSQRALAVPGEVVVPLAPLREAAAVELFGQRAAARGSAFVLTPETTPAVARLCHALDGLPLAIELAAARTRILTVDEIARRLDDRFALLADPTSAAPERRRTLTAALSWSYDLLFPDDQRGLWALAAFPAGATLPAVEHVLGALGVPAVAALDVVERLADRSLVTAHPDDRGTRYRLLDSVRAHAAARATEAGEADTVGDALVGWVAELAAGVAAGIRGPAQAERIAVVAAERATIDAALDRARRHDPAAALRIVGDLGWAWIVLDDAGAAVRARAALAAAPEAPPALRVPVLLLAAWSAAMSDDLRPAREALDAAYAEAGDDPDLAALADWYAGFVLFQEGRPAEALAALERCRTVYAERGETWWEGGSLLLAAFAHLALGDVVAGRAACAEAVRLVTPHGDAWGLLHAEAALGRAAHAEGLSAEAAVHHGHAATAAARLGFTGAAALHRTHLGLAQLAAGDPAAADTLDAAVTGAETARDLRLLAMARVARAEAHLGAGEPAAARELLAAAHRWYSEAGAGDGAARAAELLAATTTGPAP